MDPPGPKDSAPVEAVSPPAIDTEERNPDQDGQKDKPFLAPLPPMSNAQAPSQPPSNVNPQWTQQVTNSATPPPEPNQSPPTDPSVAPNLQPRLPPTQYTAMPNFGPPTGMQNVPLQYWFAPAGGNPQGQIVYTGNPGWFGTQPYVQQQQGSGRPSYQQVPHQQFYVSNGLPIHQQPYAQLQLGPGSGAEAAQQPNGQPASNQHQAAPRPSQGLMSLVMGIQKSGTPGPQQTEAQFQGNTSQHLPSQQLGAAYVPGQFLPQGTIVQNPGEAQPTGPFQHAIMTSGDGSGLIPGHPGHENMQMHMTQLMGAQQPRPHFWPGGMPINQHSVVHGGNVYQIKGPVQSQTPPPKDSQDPANPERPSPQETEDNPTNTHAVQWGNISSQQTWTVPPKAGISGQLQPQNSGQIMPRVQNDSHPTRNRELPLSSQDVPVKVPQPSRPQVFAPGRVLNLEGSQVIPPGKTRQCASDQPFSSAEGATGPDGETLYFRPVRGACSRRRKSSQTGQGKEDQADPGNTSESWSFLPGMTSTGKRRRRHPVAEVKGNWTPEEDAKLIELVKLHGEGNWSKLLPEFRGRIGKQLRERWNHELRPDISKEGWTHDEECGLIEAHKIHGNCWAEIAKHYPRRTQNGIKNHWHATARKVSRAPAHANPSTPLQAYLRALQRKGAHEPAENGKAEQGRKRGSEDEEPHKRVKVANDDFHLKFDRPAERSSTPEARDQLFSRQRATKRLNAEELAVADGLLGLGEAGKHKSSESTDSAEEDDSSPPPRPKSRRLPVQANISAQGSIRRKRQAQLDEVEDRYASEGQEEIETLHNGSLVSVVANAAVAADGLKKVGAVDIDETAGFILEKAIKDGNQAELEKYLLEAVQTFHEIQHAGNGLQNLLRQFAGIPGLWDLYDTLKNEEKSA